VSATHGRRADIPDAIGIGLRGPHMAELLATRPAIGWLEVHAENYLDAGPLQDRLLRVRADYPLSLHGVGLSLGSAEGVDREHLQRFARLVELTEPSLISDHLSWSIAGGTYLNDLLPLPYTEEALDVVACNVALVQDTLGRLILVENPSRYLSFKHSMMAEPEFLTELVRRTGCGLLCDVNNIHVSCANTGGDPDAYLAALPKEAVGEIHLAGHAVVQRSGLSLLIDDHGSPVSEAVWRLYRAALDRFGLVPSMVEWDKQLPPLPRLLDEARLAELTAENVLYALAS
jgi:uncharacterized protein